MAWKGGYKNRKASQHSRGSRQDGICDGREQVRLTASEIRGDESVRCRRVWQRRPD